MFREDLGRKMQPLPQPLSLCQGKSGEDQNAVIIPVTPTVNVINTKHRPARGAEFEFPLHPSMLVSPGVPSLGNCVPPEG